MRALAVFAYGTLVTGGLDTGIDTLIRRRAVDRQEACIRGRLYDLGAFPALVPSPWRDELVHGQLLYLRDPRRCLAAIDAYEGCDPERPERGLYRRTWNRLRLADGQPAHAWVYWYNGSLATARRIPDGDWQRWCRRTMAAQRRGAAISGR